MYSVVVWFQHPRLGQLGRIVGHAKTVQAGWGLYRYVNSLHQVGELSSPMLNNSVLTGGSVTTHPPKSCVEVRI